MPNMEMPEQLRPGEHGNPVEDMLGTEMPEEIRRPCFGHDNGGLQCPVSLSGIQDGREEGGKAPSSPI